MLNVVCLQGRFTADPILRTTEANGTPVVTFSLAVQRNYKAKNADDYGVDFINCTAWRGTAEFISKYFKKGQQCTVSGTLQSRSYDDKDGNKRYVTEVMVTDVNFADSKGSSSSDGEEAVAASPNAVNEFEELSDDGDLPF